MSPTAIATPATFLIVGDTHSIKSVWQKVITKAASLGITMIVSAGDLETTDGGDLNFISWLSELLAENGITLMFVDGNHDRHNFLLYLMDGHYDQPCEVRENIFYLPRGYRWNWHGTIFLAAGGAYSIDREGQEQHMIYEPREILSQADVDRCVHGGPADVIIAHDCPIEIDLATHHQTAARPRPWTRGDSTETDRNREYLSEIVGGANPNWVVHGHYHLDYEGCYANPHTDREIRVTGLGANAEPGSMRLVQFGHSGMCIDRVD